MAIKISGTTVIDDSRNIQNVGVVTATGGIQGIGIYSGSNLVTTGVITALNFVGTGNTFQVTGNRVDISIAGGGGGISSTGIATAFLFSNVSAISTSITLENGNNNYGAFGPISVGTGFTVTVGAANTFTIV